MFGQPARPSSLPAEFRQSYRAALCAPEAGPGDLAVAQRRIIAVYQPGMTAIGTDNLHLELLAGQLAEGHVRSAKRHHTDFGPCMEKSNNREGNRPEFCRVEDRHGSERPWLA